MSYDKINPSHYKDSPSKCEECGEPIEAIVVTEQMNFNLGNAVKYVWRAGKKPGSDIVEDLKKAQWYLDREIQRIEKELTSKAIDVLSSQATEKGCSGKCKQKELPDSLRAAITSVCCSPEVSADTVIKPGYVQEQLAQTIRLTPEMLATGNVGTFTPVFDTLKENEQSVIAPEIDKPSGYQRLFKGETLQEGDECWNVREQKWHPTKFPGTKIAESGKASCIYRRKVDAGEGYRLLQPGEVIKSGDEVFMSQGSWSKSDAFDQTVGGMSYTKCTYRRKVKYRTLDVGETLRDGDEYRQDDGSYKPTKYPNWQVAKVDEGRYRRMEDCPE